MAAGKTRTGGAFLVLAGCILLTATGCQFHRTGHGFIFASRWSLELDTNGGACAAPCEGCPAAPACSTEQVRGNPELLPLHTKLRRGGIASRLFHRGETADLTSKYPDEKVPEALTDLNRRSPPPAKPPAQTEESKYEKKPAPSVGVSEVRLPTEAVSLLESKRPRPVLN
jgi:hypothetical protein